MTFLRTRVINPPQLIKLWCGESGSLTSQMRAAAILGLGCSPKQLAPFQTNNTIEWRMGMPSPDDAVDIVLIFGGDGTIHRHLGSLVRLGIPVLVIPAGSGNDFARALGLRHIRDSLAAWNKFSADKTNSRTIDLGIVTPLGDGLDYPSAPEHYFCCVAGVGLDGEVAKQANLFPRWLRGRGGYVLSLAPKIFTFSPFPMKIFVPEGQDGSWAARSDQPTILAAIANTPVYGDGMKIAPRAKMDDGLFDICVVGGVDPFKLFCMFPTVYAGKHLNIKEVGYFTAPKVRIETEHPLDVYADGEYVCRTPVEIAVKAASLKAVTL